MFENRLRRTADRRGYRLLKSRRRDPRAIGFGGYMLVGISNNAVVCGASPYEFSASLEEIESFLNGD